MSDYLTRLVARTFDAADVMRPRPLGLFETDRRGEEALVVTDVDEESVEGTVRAAAAEPHVDTARFESLVVRHATPALAAAPVAEPPEPARRPHGPVPAAPEPAASAVAPLVVTETPRGAPRRDSSIDSPPVVRAAPLQNAQPTQGSPPEPRLASLTAPGVVHEVRPAAGRSPRSGHTGEPQVTPRSPMPPALKEPTVPPAVKAADPEPRRAAAARQPATAARHRSINASVNVATHHIERPDRGRETSRQPPASPTIHVTIGCVEVRATPAPVAAARSRPATTPVMSLDEYLRQRAAKGTA